MATEPSVGIPSTAEASDQATLALAILSFTAGCMDAIAFVALGQVFTSAMSGNTILLGLAVGQGHFAAALHSLLALLAYMGGVAAASMHLGKSRRLIPLLKLEALFLAGFVALWLATGGPSRPAAIYGLIVLSAIAMGMQGAVGRALGIPGLMTVIFTSTYTAIVGSVAEHIRTAHRPLLTGRTRQQATALATYLGSAMLCGFVTTHWLPIAPWLPLAGIFILLGGLEFRLLHLGCEQT